MLERLQQTSIACGLLLFATCLPQLAGCGANSADSNSWDPGADAGPDAESPDTESDPPPDTTPDTNDPCSEDPPFLCGACDTDTVIPPECEEGEWTCGEGRSPENELTCDPEDRCGSPEPECVESCSETSSESATCEMGLWSCPDGTFQRDRECDSTASCTEGDNFTNLRVVDGYEQESEESPFLRIAWDQGTGNGADLPRAYFEAAELAEGSDPVAESVELTDDREFTVRFSEIPSGETSFIIVLPDRRDYIECSHPGMDDRYLLHVTLQTEEGSDALESVTFEEDIDLGDE